jgi:hypothetical protein
LPSDHWRTLRVVSANKNLVASHPGNINGARHGLYSDRVLAPRIEEYRTQLLALPHVAAVDAAAIDEAARLLARIEAVDADLDARGHFGKGGARSLLDHRARLSRELRAWLGALGALPSARADWVAKLTRGSLSDEIRARLADLDQEGKR